MSWPLTIIEDECDDQAYRIMREDADCQIARAIIRNEISITTKGGVCVPIMPNIVMYFPSTNDGKQELAQLVSAVHADAVDSKLRTLNCPNKQKVQLLQELINQTQSS